MGFDLTFCKRIDVQLIFVKFVCIGLNSKRISKYPRSSSSLHILHSVIKVPKNLFDLNIGKSVHSPLPIAWTCFIFLWDPEMANELIIQR